MDPQERADQQWRRIEQSPLRDAYLSELYWLARDSVETCAVVFDAAKPPPDETSSYISVDHNLQSQIYRVLNNAARIRALVSDRARQNSQSAAQYRFQQARTRWLKSTLADLGLREVLHARVRNSLEHFDEYLDQTALRFSQGTVSGRVLLPMDVTLGREGTLDQFVTDGGSVYPLRVYLAEERTFVNCGKRVDLDRIAQECQAVVDRLTKFRPDLAEEVPSSAERGSSMLVLTPETFRDADTVS